MKSGEIVVVTHEQYTKILHNLASSLQQIETDKGDLKDDTELDAHAHAITQFIRCRWTDGDADENAPFLVDAQHLTVVREFKKWSCSAMWSTSYYAWMDLVQRTAKNFGYFFQLAEDYNIKIHAELQYYEQDLVTWTLGSSSSTLILFGL
ncbi:hypothetical protein BD410DRAFT_780763 [Rickenella mellea]|uniref:Uncharacterized protein n=1 Tax=Rickenella mellea TaxID=50990 RepID=A0A4R5XGB8_9AGAM|nr:hypothetical protein BD410DRAFT_780763 [Rickenella mellea]